MSGTLCKNVLSNKLSKLVYTNSSGKPASATLNVQKLSTTENACISVKVATCTALPVTNTEVSSTIRSQEQFTSFAFCGSTGNYAGQMFRNSCSGIDAFDDTINGTVANTGLSATLTLPNNTSCAFTCSGDEYWPSTSNYPIHKAAFDRCSSYCAGVCADEYWNSNVQTFTYHYPNYALPSVQARLKSVADKNGGFTVVPIRPAASNCFGQGTNGSHQLYAFYPFACICNANTAVLQSKMATGWDVSDAGICQPECGKGLASAVDFYGDHIHLMAIRQEQRDCMHITTYSDYDGGIDQAYCFTPDQYTSPSGNCCVYGSWCTRQHCYNGSPVLGMRYQNFLHVGCEAVLYPQGGCCNKNNNGDYTVLYSYNGDMQNNYSYSYTGQNKENNRRCQWQAVFSCCWNANPTYCCTKRPRISGGIVKWMVYDPYTCRNIAYVKSNNESCAGVYQIKPECLRHTQSTQCCGCAYLCYTWEEAAEQAWATKLGSLDNSNLYTCYQSTMADNYTQHMSTPFQVDDQCWVSYVPCMVASQSLAGNFNWNGCLVKFVSSDLISWTCGESSTTSAVKTEASDGSTNTTHIGDFAGGNIIKAVDQFCNDSFLPGQSYIEYKVSGNQFERSGLVIGDGESVYVTDDSDTTSETAVQLWGYDE